MKSNKLKPLNISFIVFAMCILAAVFPFLLNSTYKGSQDIHATIEMDVFLWGHNVNNTNRNSSGTPEGRRVS